MVFFIGIGINLKQFNGKLIKLFSKKNRIKMVTKNAFKLEIICDV